MAHALFDVDPVLYAGFAHTVYDGKPSPCDAPRMLAQRIVDELEYARFELLESREIPREDMTPMRRRLQLFDLIFFALHFATQARLALMGDPDPAIAGEARTYATAQIREALSIGRARLGSRRAGN